MVWTLHARTVLELLQNSADSFDHRSEACMPPSTSRSVPVM